MTFSRQGFPWERFLDNQVANDHCNNKLLSGLSIQDFELLQRDLTLTPLVLHESIFSAGEAAEYVWFPHEGVISLVAIDAEGEAVEVATVGSEGMTGVAVVLGSDTMTNRAMVQVSGRGSKIRTSAFRNALQVSPTLKQYMLRYILAVVTQISQNAACNQLHTINTRCARWLLTTHDRVEGDSFGLTQEYLAMMLGVTRVSVSAAAGALQKAGLIRYSRGVVTITDRAGLEEAACDCYRVIEDEFVRLRTASL